MLKGHKDQAFLSHEDETDRFSQNAITDLPLYTFNTPEQRMPLSKSFLF
jgi:hypothetical protein